MLTSDEALRLPGLVTPVPSWNTFRAVLLAQYPDVSLLPPVQTIVTGYVWDYIPHNALFAEAVPRLYAHTFVLYGNDESLSWSMSAGTNSVYLGPKRIIALLRWYLG